MPLPAGGNTAHPSAVARDMDLAAALDFVRTNRRAVMVTIRASGRPQLSNVLYDVTSGGEIRVSITADRAKYHNLTREPWMAMHITTDDFYSYVVLEGTAHLGKIASRNDDPVVDELVDYYRALSGEHEDWNAYRTTMVDDRRTVVRFKAERSYGMIPTSGG